MSYILDFYFHPCLLTININSAWRDKKAFLSDQHKETEGNNIMEKARDLFKKIKDTKGTLHTKMDTIKDRKVMGLKGRGY